LVSKKKMIIRTIKQEVHGKELADIEN
jgi:hypothetical protein